MNLEIGAVSFASLAWEDDPTGSKTWPLDQSRGCHCNEVIRQKAEIRTMNERHLLHYNLDIMYPFLSIYCVHICPNHWDISQT